MNEHKELINLIGKRALNDRRYKNLPIAPYIRGLIADWKEDKKEWLGKGKAWQRQEAMDEMEHLEEEIIKLAKEHGIIDIRDNYTYGGIYIPNDRKVRMYKNDLDVFGEIKEDLIESKEINSKKFSELLDLMSEFYEDYMEFTHGNGNEKIENELDKNRNKIYKLATKLNVYKPSGKPTERKRSRPKKAKSTFRSGDSQGKDMIRNMNRMTGTTLKRFQK